MRTNKLIWVPVSAAALFAVTCAPVDKPSETQPKVADTRQVEELPTPPSPVPAADGPRLRIEAAINHVRNRELLTDHGFWTIFHGILGLGPGLTLRDTASGQRVNAVDFICNGGEIPGLKFPQTKWGLDVQLGPMTLGQGHQDQFVAEMGQWGMPADRLFVVNGIEYSFMDFVHNSKMRARINANQELSWTIVIVGQYLGTDISWTNSNGEDLRFEELMQYELDASVEKAACGGTHRLFGLCWAYHLHMLKGGKKEGVWKGVADKTAKYCGLAKKYRNPDGSLSTEFFRGPGNTEDMNLRINTTGHTLEWLALALSDEEIKQPWVQEAASALSIAILDLQNRSIDGGALYHAVHGLLLYYARVYGRTPLIPPELLYHLPPDWAAAGS